ncbi:MAG: Flp pilus assembly protein CpaB [Candidatus Binataceae bacterium]
MNRSIVFFLLAGLAATLAALIVYSSLKKKDEEFRRVLARMVPIVVAAHDIAVGAKLDAGAIKLARRPRNSLPPAAITDPNSVIGSVARAEFVENEPIVATRLVSGDKAAGVLPLMIPSDMRAMSVAVDEVADLAGFVLPDTRVDVLLSLPGTDAEAGRSKIILENIRVLAVAQILERKDSPQPVRVVTLLVSPEEAERLAVASTQGRLHLALRGYGDNAVVSTAGSDVHKVMSAYSSALPEPVQVRQESTMVRLTPRRVVPRRQLPERVEVLRDGRSREAVMIGRDGRAFDGNSAALELEPRASASDAGIADLGNDGTGPGSQVETVAPEDGMRAGGAGVNSGENQ